jgi:hypothetical protein
LCAGDEEGEIKVPAEIEPVARWICERAVDESFGMAELEPMCASREVLELLDVLEEMGAIEREVLPRRAGRSKTRR